MRAAGVDGGDQVGQRHMTADRDILQPPPESVLKTDAGLVSGDDDRALDDWRLHCPSPLSTRCWSRSLWALSLADRVWVRSALVRPWTRRLAAADCSDSRRFCRLRALRRLTMSPIKKLGGNQVGSRPSR